MVPRTSIFVALALVNSVIAAPPNFNRDVAPILVKRCLECHNARQKAGELVLTTSKLAMKGGDSGHVITPGKPSDSPLIDRITAGEMPPKKRGKSQQLPSSEIAVLRAWIQAGAKWPANRTLDLYESTNDVRGGRDWWSFQPVKRPVVPKPPIAGGVNPIDAFVLDQLSRKKMLPAPLADKRMLIRRLYYDLIGLPPSFEQVESFVNDRSPDAWKKQVDTLLRSKHYGERWARYWLDLVRFAETCGYERDQVKPYVWKYRDWVVKSFNDDKPYNQFVIEQIAGDELPKPTEQTVVATGFLRLGTWNDEPNDPQEYKYERLEDMVHATSSAFLALTVKCARCHDHKFDPILQRDYYRMATAFWAGPIQPGDRGLLGGPTNKQLGMKNVFGWTDTGRNPVPLRLLKNGEPKKPGPIVKPAHLSTLPAIYREFRNPPKGAKTTQRRLQLAKWIADAKNPLVARVLVNRLWQHHFGDGLVRTPNNFGFRGNKPTHPKLLDWLASEFVAGKWKIKRMHRLILLSRTYRQSVSHPQHRRYELLDSANTLCWRANRRRLDAESIRDSILMASARIDLRMGGPSFRPTIAKEALEGLSRKQSAWIPSPQKEQRRRSLYIFSKRGLLPPMMTTFDFGDTTLPCGRRNSTTVAPQALAMLNNHFVHAQSTAMAKRVRAKAGKDLQVQIKSAWQMALGRNPQPEEVELATAHLASQLRRFRNQKSPQKPGRQAVTKLMVKSGLALHVRADKGVRSDAGGRVSHWKNQASRRHDAGQPSAANRPLLVKDGFNGKPLLRFDGKRRFLHVQGKLLSNVHTTIFAVVNDRAQGGHREILSNWTGSNSTTSIFLGLTATNTVRFSDLFVAGRVANRQRQFILTAAHGTRESAIFQNSRRLATSASFSLRNLSTPWVIGQQGTINGEYWNGDIAEILVFDRTLRESERQSVWGYLMNRYAIKPSAPVVIAPPDQLALASLCHVLLNSNEFMYID